MGAGGGRERGLTRKRTGVNRRDAHRLGRGEGVLRRELGRQAPSALHYAMALAPRARTVLPGPGRNNNTTEREPRLGRAPSCHGAPVALSAQAVSGRD